MFWVLASVLLVAWAVGWVKEPMGGFIHVLLVLALIVVITELLLGWRRKRLARNAAIADDGRDEIDLPRAI